MPIIEQQGLNREDILRRIDKAAAVSPGMEPVHGFVATVKGLVNTLIDLGVPFPLWMLFHDPRRPSFTRQGVRQLQPGTSDTFTFKAREHGYLILDGIEIAPQDGLSYETLRVEFFISGVENSIDYSTPGDGSEPGIWKFSKQVLWDNKKEFKVVVSNSDGFGINAYSFLFMGREY